jgi:hypothetical protein
MGGSGDMIIAGLYIPVIESRATLQVGSFDDGGRVPPELSLPVLKLMAAGGGPVCIIHCENELKWVEKNKVRVIITA